MATFKRSLFSGMANIFDAIERARKGPIGPTAEVIDEIMCLMIQSPLAQVNLKAKISPEISCTDASPTGGGSATATAFKPGPDPHGPMAIFEGKCHNCGHDFSTTTPTRSEGRKQYPCAVGCGSVSCSVRCAIEHREHGCARDMFACPLFGERFSGPNFPLTKAVALAGIGVQPPLDLLIDDDRWDYSTVEGKQRLDAYESAPGLLCEHYGPECKTFSAARGRPIRTTSGRWLSGPRALRSELKPWGLDHLSPAEQVQVRRGNTMAKRSLRGLKTAFDNDRLAVLEHPYSSHLWSTPEASELAARDDVFHTYFSACCYGGARTKWTSLLHNIEELHTALHRPTCPGHEGLLPYEVHDEEGILRFDTAIEAEYTWGLCQAYAAGLKKAFQKRTSVPHGHLAWDPKEAILAALRRSTKGLQRLDVADAAAEEVMRVLRTMRPGHERRHLRGLLREVCIRGTEVRFEATPEDGSQTLLVPYPAFKWQWKTRLSFPWTHPDVSGNARALVDDFQMELRRRTQSALRALTMPKGQKHLRDLGIAGRTIRIYQREVSLFLDHLDACGIDLPRTFYDLDSHLAEYINLLYQEGESISRAGWVLSGLKRLYPRCRKELQTSQQWYTNWTREHTPQRATPITWNTVQGFIGLCIRERWYHLGLTILLSFVFFLRIGETMTLLFSDITLDHSSGSVVLRLGFTKSSKQFQQFVAHSDPLFVVLISFFLQHLPGGGRVWPYSLTYFRSCFTGLADFFDLTSFHLVPYSLRRGGATHFYGVHKALDFVMIQGRWKDQRTARQYLDDARATLITMRFSPLASTLLTRYRHFFLHFVTSLRK